jgi:hypothetical protein
MVEMSNNATLDYMLKQKRDTPLTKENFIELNWFGQKTVNDLEGEELIEVAEFERAVQELGAPDAEE